MSVLKHVGVLSVAKITALFGLVFGLVYGIIFAVFASTLLMIMPMASSLGAAGAGGVGAVIVVLMAIAGAVGGFIYGAVVAFLYNVFAGWVGGVQVDLI
ncbi:MAG: hypothetical protein LUQ32_06255 [Methanomicrobiales archaeon]|nr:hypothetical protein [Methanomicrobiales archaeon]